MATKRQATTHGSHFLRAANVELDVDSPGSLEDYVLTSTGRRVLRRLAESVNGDSRSRSWTLTGPYGTGKSAFAVFTARLLATGNAATTKNARQLLNDTDPELAGMLGMTGRSRSGLIPIPITGTREPIEGAILRGVESTVGSRLNGTGKTLTSELKRARKRIAAGKSVGSRRVTELVSDSVDKLCSGARGIEGVFLILDELGKLLEYANHHSATSDLFTLQQLAEQFSRSDHRCLMMGVLHQDFGAYATRLSSVERAEWGKIRGRFEDIAFEEPAEEMLRLVSTVISHADFKVSQSTHSEVRRIAADAWKIGLAPGSMSKREFLAILEKCAPLHPVVAVSVGTVFRRLAQNERSAFSFLCSNEPFGLKEFTQGKPGRGLYGIDRLYDYLTHSIRDALYSSSQSKLWAEVEDTLNSLTDATEADAFLVKAIGLINATGRDDRIKSSRELLTLASKGCLEKPVGKPAFASILSRKLVVDRKFNQTLALWEGSDVDIDAELRAARSRIDRDTPIAQLAERYFPCRPVVARRHSFETGTFRYFPIRFVSTNDVGQPQDGGPLTIEIALPESPTDERTVRAALKKKEFVVAGLGRLVCVPKDRNEFAKGIFELAALKWVRENVTALEGDRSARRELAIRIEGVQQNLSSLIAEFLTPDEYPRRSDWFHLGKPTRFTRDLRFQDHLSTICDRVFDKSPRLLNELINRRQLSSAAASARRTLIERMFSHRNEAELGLQKAPPEKSMYLSVIARSGLHSDSKDGWEFRPPSGRNSSRMQPTWAAISSFFRKTESGSRPVSELFDVLASPPYGILEGPLPVLFCAALLVYDNEVALYKDGTFIPMPGAPDFELLVKHPDRYTVQRWHVTGVRATVFQQLAKLFGREFTGKTAGKSEILDLVRPLLRFYQNLNKFTMQTQQISPEAIAIRTALGKATEPDTLLFSTLPKAVGLKPFSKSRKATIKQIEQFINRLRAGLNELQTAYDRLLGAIQASLRTTFSIKGELSTVRKTLAERAQGLSDCSGDPVLQSFVERALESELDDQEWLETLSSLLILAQPANWKDEDLKRFQNELRSVGRLFHHVEAIAYAEPSGRRRKSGESLRIGITQQNARELEKVVHITEKQSTAVEKAAEAIESVLKKSGKNDDVALAALARVAQKRLSK